MDKPDIVRWYEQHQADQLVNRVRALALLRRVRQSAPTLPYVGLAHLTGEIDAVLAEAERLTAELLDPAKRVIRAPMHAPDQEAA